MLKPEGLISHVERFKVLKSKVNNHPLLLRANDSPEKIGKYNRNDKYMFCYMGCDYFPECKPTKYSGFYHGTKDHKKYLNYNARKNIYLSSTFALGFQSYENIKSEHVSQRIYEGLAYGCVVLTNSQPACIQTQGICVYVTSKNDIEDKIKYYLQHPDEIKKKQEKGYEFIKKMGTNQYSIDGYKSIIKTIYNINI